MAEQKRGTKRSTKRSSGGGSGKKRSSSDGSRGKSLSAGEAVRKAREQIEELLGREAETISSFEADGSKGWVVKVEVVELERIPESTSLLGSYEARLDRKGELVACRRVRRYARNQVDSEQEDTG